MVEGEGAEAIAAQRTIARFNDAVRCRHDIAAYFCGQRDQSGRKTCNPGSPLDAVTAGDRTVGGVIREFAAQGLIGHAELEVLVRGTVRRRKIRDLSAAGGLAIAGIATAIVGGKMILRLWPAKKPEGAGKP